MRILIVSHYFWPENFRINDLTDELVRRGHDVTVLTGCPNYPEGTIFPAFRANPAAFSRFGDVPIIRVPMIPRGRSSVGLLVSYITAAASASFIGAWRLRRQRFDTIFVFQPSPVTTALPAILLSRLKRAPVSLWILDLWPDTLAAIGVVQSPRLLALVDALVRFIYKRCDLILIQSRAFRQKVVASAGREDAIRYFPAWAEAVFDQQVDAAEIPAELEPYRDNFKIIFAGNVGEAQDFPAILNAAEKLADRPKLRWIIIGDGRAAAMVRNEIARRGLQDRVVMLGRFPLKRMPSFFAAADALLVTLRPEQIWSMTIPGKVQSYLSAGKPLLAMLDGEGARMIEEAEAGLVAPAGDSAALADLANQLMATDPAERAKMGRAALGYGRREFDRLRLMDLLEVWLNETHRSVE